MRASALVFILIFIFSTFASADFDKVATLRTLAGQFKAAKKIEDKVTDALMIKVVSAQIPVKLTPLFLWPDPKILQSLGPSRPEVERALKFADDLDRQAEEFETHLTSGQVKTIAARHPDSLEAKTGILLQAAKARQCKQTDYDRLKSRLAPDALARMGMSFMGLGSLYDLLYQPEIQENIYKFLNSSKTFTDKYPGLPAYFKFYGESMVDSDFKNFVANSIKSDEGDLAKLNMPQPRARSYVEWAATVAPGCILVTNFDFGDFVKTDISVLRGKYILNQIDQSLKAGGKLPANPISLFSPKEGDALYDSPQDGWGHDYIINVTPSTLVVNSQGKPGAKGSLNIGSINY